MSSFSALTPPQTPLMTATGITKEYSNCRLFNVQRTFNIWRRCLVKGASCLHNILSIDNRAGLKYCLTCCTLLFILVKSILVFPTPNPTRCNWSTQAIFQRFSTLYSPCLSHSQSLSVAWRSYVRVSAIDLVTDIMKKVTSQPKIQMALPNLTTDGRFCFYGYHISKEWLIEYATAHWCWLPLETGYYDNLSKMSGAIKLLGWHTGIKGLRYETALVDNTVPSDAVTISVIQPGVLYVTLLSIFSDEGPSFRKRPSQEQVDRLSQIIGKQPRWWIDFKDPLTYRE